MKTIKAAGYCRVSSEDQVDGTSLGYQQSQIEAYCHLKGFELVRMFVDKAVSGGDALAGRKEGSKLMGMTARGEVDAVVTMKLDRAFRDTVNCLQCVDLWDKQGVALHIVDLGGSAIDTQSPSGRFMLTVLAAAAEMERSRIAQRGIGNIAAI